MKTVTLKFFFSEMNAGVCNTIPVKVPKLTYYMIILSYFHISSFPQVEMLMTIYQRTFGATVGRIERDLTRLIITLVQSGYCTHATCLLYCCVHIAVTPLLAETLSGLNITISDFGMLWYACWKVLYML